MAGSLMALLVEVIFILQIRPKTLLLPYIGKSHVLNTNQANVAFQHPLVPFAWLYGWVPPQRPKIEPLIRSLEGGWPAQQWIDVIL
jgi:hypothetical protein